MGKPPAGGAPFYTPVPGASDANKRGGGGLRAPPFIMSLLLAPEASGPGGVGGGNLKKTKTITVFGQDRNRLPNYNNIVSGHSLEVGGQ